MKKSRKTKKEKSKSLNLRNKRRRKRDNDRKMKDISFVIENFEKEISKPSSVDIVNGNKVRLYHFTHPCYIKGILQDGLNRGFVWMEETYDSDLDMGKGDDLICVPCMTSNPIGSDNGQSNLTGNGDKELVRFSFLIDKDDLKIKQYSLWFWNELLEYFDDPIKSYDFYNKHKVSGKYNIQDWFVYLDVVRPEMIESVYLKSNRDGKYYNNDELDMWSWNGLRYEDLPEPSQVLHSVRSKYTIYKDYTGYLENTKLEHWSKVS